MNIWKKTAAFSILFVGISLAQAQKSRKVESIHGTSAQSVKDIKVDGVGHTQSYSSDGGNAEVAGADNVITINGYASKLEVSGSGNTVYVDKVTHVALEGANNKVFYKTSPTKTGKPNVSLTGVGNSVRKR